MKKIYTKRVIKALIKSRGRRRKKMMIELDWLIGRLWYSDEFYIGLLIDKVTDEDV